MDSIQSILFDLDGTLVDSPIDFALMRQRLNITKETDILTHLGELEANGSQSEFKKASQIIFDLEKEAAENSRVFDGVQELLDFLKQNEINLGVITRNNGEISSLQLNSLEDYFLKVLSRDDVTEPKPHPESFEFFRNQHDVDPQKTVFIGNHHHDQEFAENCGLRYLQYNPNLNNEDDGEDFEFSCYFELINFLTHEELLI